MFTKSDQAFLDRLGARAEVSLGRADPTADQLHHAIDSLRRMLASSPDIDVNVLGDVDDLLDAVWWASSSGEIARAREMAARLARSIRALDLPGSRSMSVVDAALQIRALVVLAA